jgi:hypothetical protein
MLDDAGGVRSSVECQDTTRSAEQVTGEWIIEELIEMGAPRQSKDRPYRDLDINGLRAEGRGVLQGPNDACASIGGLAIVVFKSKADCLHQSRSTLCTGFIAAAWIPPCLIGVPGMTRPTSSDMRRYPRSMPC